MRIRASGRFDKNAVVPVSAVVAAFLLLSGCDAGTYMAPTFAIEEVRAGVEAHTFTGLEETAQLTAEAFDASGNVVPGVSLDWTTSNSGIATVSSSGLVTARAAGTAMVVVTALCCSASDTVAILVQESRNDLVVLTTHSFDQEVPSGWELYGNKFRITSDSTAPESPSNVGEMYYPAGFVGGSGPAALNYSVAPGKNRLHLRFQFKVSDNWQGHDSGVGKIFFINTKDNKNKSRAIVAFSAQGSYANTLNFQVRTQRTVEGAVNYGASHASNEVSPPAGSDVVSRGQWHDVQVYLIGNTPDQRDGEIHAWIDGVKILQFTNVGLAPAIWSSDGTTTPVDDNGRMMWTLVSWNPTWGGGSHDTVEADQYQYIDHIEVTGGN